MIENALPLENVNALTHDAINLCDLMQSKRGSLFIDDLKPYLLNMSNILNAGRSAAELKLINLSEVGFMSFRLSTT